MAVGSWQLARKEEEKKANENYKFQITNYKQIPNSKLQNTNPSLETEYKLSQWGNMLGSMVRCLTEYEKLLRGVQGGGFLEKSPHGRRRHLFALQVLVHMFGGDLTVAHG